MLDTDDAGSAAAESKLLEHMNHPNILQFHDSFVEGNIMNIITELCEGGDLNGYITDVKERGRTIPEKLVMDWLVQLTLALNYMHQRLVLHRDLKSNNIFLRHGIIKVGDFGIARVLQGTMEMPSTFAGTPYYMSPECLQSKGYNSKSDIWSLGCVLFEICSLKHAFDGDQGKCSQNDLLHFLRVARSPNILPCCRTRKKGYRCAILKVHVHYLQLVSAWHS